MNGRVAKRLRRERLLNPVEKIPIGSSRDNKIKTPEPKPKTIYPQTVTTNHERMLYRKQLRTNHESNNL